MFLLHHQVYDPVDVIWDADDWSDMTDNELSTDGHYADREEETNMDQHEKHTTPTNEEIAEFFDNFPNHPCPNCHNEPRDDTNWCHLCR